MERSQLGLLLAKVEGAYGTDPVPAANANVIAVAGSQITWAPGFERIMRKVLDGSWENVSGFNAMPVVGMTFRVEMRGNRTDGATADISKGAIANLIEIDPLLRACDLAATYTAETGLGNRDGYVTYKTTTPADVGVSVTFYWYSGLKLHKLIGGKGNLKMVFEAGKMAYIDFEFKGKLAAVTDAAIPGPTWLNTKPPLFVSSGSTIAAYSPIFRKLEFDLGNQIQRRDDAQSTDGVKGFYIADRAPKVTIDPESVAEATNPVWADLISSVSRTITVKIGTDTGNKFQGTFIGEPDSVNYADAAGLRITNISYALTRALLSDTQDALALLKFY